MFIDLKLVLVGLEKGIVSGSVCYAHVVWVYCPRREYKVGKGKEIQTNVLQRLPNFERYESG